MNRNALNLVCLNLVCLGVAFFCDTLSMAGSQAVKESVDKNQEQQSLPDQEQSDPLDKQFDEVANRIRNSLRELKVTKCTFGNIAPEQGNSEFGKRLIAEVEPRLRELSIDVGPEAPIVISGTFVVLVPNDNQPAARFQLSFKKPDQVRPESFIEATILFAAETSIESVQRDKTDREAEDALLAASVTTTCPPHLSLLDRRKEMGALLRESRDRTEITELTYVNPDGKKVEEQVARVGKGLGYAVQIRSGGSPLTHSITRSPLNDRPIGFVPLQANDDYQIRLINPLPHDAVANVEIDGVSVFRYCKLSPPPEFFLVPAGGAIDIHGWMSDTAETYKFQIMTFADSARAKEGLAPPGDGLGIISVSFRYAWTQNPPDDEGSAKIGTQGTGQLPALTGLGPLIEQKYESVKRHTGFQSDVIHLRYGKTTEATQKALTAVVNQLQP